MASYQLLASFYFWYQLEFMVIGGSEIQSSYMYMDRLYTVKKSESWRILHSPRLYCKIHFLIFYARGSFRQKIININRVHFYLEFIYWRMKEDCMGCYLYSKQKKDFCKSVDRTFLFVCLLASSILHSIYFWFFSFESELFYFRFYKLRNCFSFLLKYLKRMQWYVYLHYFCDEYRKCFSKAQIYLWPWRYHC